MVRFVDVFLYARFITTQKRFLNQVFSNRFLGFWAKIIMPYSLNKISVATVSGVQRLRWAPKNRPPYLSRKYTGRNMAKDAKPAVLA